MPRIEFYTLEPDSPGDRYLLTCRLVEDLYQAHQRVLIHCPDAATARHLDRLLWTFRQASFVPHGLAGQTDAALTPVLIAREVPAGDPREVLVNLAPSAPPEYTRFARVCEPLDQDPAVRAAARARFRWYREQGFPPEHHAMRLTHPEADGR